MSIDIVGKHAQSKIVMMGNFFANNKGT